MSRSLTKQKWLEWLATLSPADRAEVLAMPLEAPPLDKGREALLAATAHDHPGAVDDEGHEADETERLRIAGQRAMDRRAAEKVRDKSRNRSARRLPVGVVEHQRGEATRIARASPTSTIYGATTLEDGRSLPHLMREASEAEAGALRHLHERLEWSRMMSALRGPGDAPVQRGRFGAVVMTTDEEAAGWLAAFTAMFGFPYRDAWIDLLLRALADARMIELARRRGSEAMTAPCGEHYRELLRRPSGRTLLEAVRVRLALSWPGVEVAEHVDEAAVDALLARYGFDGRGGKSGRVSEARIRDALQDPRELAALVRCGDQLDPNDGGSSTPTNE